MEFDIIQEWGPAGAVLTAGLAYVRYSINRLRAREEEYYDYLRHRIDELQKQSKRRGERLARCEAEKDELRAVIAELQRDIAILKEKAGL